jgi:hypothetical protein
VRQSRENAALCVVNISVTKTDFSQTKAWTLL